MIKKERKALRLIKKHFGHSEMVFLDQDNRLLISNDTSVPFPYDDMCGIIHSLSNEGILSLHDHPTETYFSLTYEGYHRFEILADNFKIAFFTRWIPGFISGVATSFLVELLIQLLLHTPH